MQADSSDWLRFGKPDLFVKSNKAWFSLCTPTSMDMKLRHNDNKIDRVYVCIIIFQDTKHSSNAQLHRCQYHQRENHTGSARHFYQQGNARIKERHFLHIHHRNHNSHQLLFKIFFGYGLSGTESMDNFKRHLLHFVCNQVWIRE